jgi:hypothetical protein
MSTYTQPLKHLPPHRKCTRIASINDGTSDNGCTRSKIREPVEIDVVKNSNPVRCQRLVVKRSELLVGAMLGAQPGSDRKDVLASRWRDQDFHASEIGSGSFRAVLPDSLTCGLHGHFYSSRIPVTQIHVPAT